VRDGRFGEPRPAALARTGPPSCRWRHATIGLGSWLGAPAAAPRLHLGGRGGIPCRSTVPLPIASTSCRLSGPAGSRARWRAGLPGSFRWARPRGGSRVASGVGAGRAVVRARDSWRRVRQNTGRGRGGSPAPCRSRDPSRSIRGGFDLLAASGPPARGALPGSRGARCSSERGRRRSNPSCSAPKPALARVADDRQSSRAASSAAARARGTSRAR
jgi:hypothetical protein